ncbi:MAG: DUF434 domain-containing protein [Candidatus Methanoperedens sp.]|nr:DUF434 domain-containing protein [Candidatus Methanoperedens sp.]
MSIGNAASDIRYLLDRDYPQTGAVGFVCNHYRLDDESRRFLSRTVLAKAVCEKRHAKFLSCDKIKGSKIMIDGYNIIIGMESIIEKKAYLCDDGVIRDIRGVFRNFRAAKNTENAIELICRFLKEKKPAEICFLLDSQISKSGALAKELREKMSYYGLKGDARTSKHVDYDLKKSKDVVATSDGVIIDAAEMVVNFLACLVSGFPHLGTGVSDMSDFTGKKA